VEKASGSLVVMLPGITAFSWRRIPVDASYNEGLLNPTRAILPWRISWARARTRAAS